MRLACWLPERLANWIPLPVGRVWSRLSPKKAAMLARHMARAAPSATSGEIRRLVNRAFQSYVRYYIESFRLPQRTATEIDAGIHITGYEHVEAGLAEGNGVILALPHLGGWEWAGFWLTVVKGLRVSVVVEALDPPELLDFFAEFRADLGMNVIVADSRAARQVGAALANNDVVCLLCDRDISGDGVQVEFFDEATTLPGGPALLALRSGAPILPTAVYFEQGGTHFGHVRSRLNTDRVGKRLRDDMKRVTQDLAHDLEALIRHAPDQWHLLQPNWPSDEPVG